MGQPENIEVVLDTPGHATRQAYRLRKEVLRTQGVVPDQYIVGCAAVHGWALATPPLTAYEGSDPEVVAAAMGQVRAAVELECRTQDIPAVGIFVIRMSTLMW